MGIEGSGIVRQVPAQHLVAVPPHISLRDACAALEHGLTAIMLIDLVARLPERAQVLVHAAAGGGGGWLAQLLLARGHQVFGTASSAEKIEWLNQLGVIALAYDQDPNWPAQVLAKTAGRGVDAVFDSVGKATFKQSLEVLAPCSHLILFGAASGQPEPVDVLKLMSKSCTLTRPVLPHYLQSAGALQSLAARVFDYLQNGSVQLRIHATYPLQQAAEAHRELAKRNTAGKLLLAIQAESAVGVLA